MTPDLREAVTRLREELARSASIAASVGATPSRTMVNDSDLKLVLSALSVPEGWRPIETAPRDGTRILLAGGGLERVNVGNWCAHVAAWDAEAEGMFEDGPAFLEGHEDGPTMWMPLPPLSAIPSPVGEGNV